MQSREKGEPGGKVSRRTALKTGAVGLVGAQCAAAMAEALTNNPFAPLKVGVHSYSLRKFPFPEAVRITKELGVRYLSLNPLHLPLESTPEQCAEAKRLLESAGITILGCGVVQFTADEAAARQAFGFARTMNMRVIAGNPAPESFDLLDKLVEEYGIPIAIHNHGPEGIYSVPEDSLKVFRSHHKLIGACVDVGHYERSGIKAAEALRALSERLYDVHLKDVNRRDRAGHAVVMGEGVIDLDAVADVLLELKFEGHVALEYEAEPESPQASMAKSLAYFREILTRKNR
jgi:sugar phosphate isomerase/epimerase